MKKILCFLLACLLFVPHVYASDQDDVYNLIKNTVDEVLVLLKDNSLDKEAKSDQFMEIIEPLFDFSLMAKLSLGKKNWPKLNEAEQKEFTDLFIKQLQNTYYDKLELFSDEKVTFEKPMAVKNKMYMELNVITKDEPLKMLYKLYQNKEENVWKIYDLEIQDISIIKSYSSQYDQILEKETVSDLLNKMKEKNLESNQEENKK